MVKYYQGNKIISCPIVSVEHTVGRAELMMGKFQLVFISNFKLHYKMHFVSLNILSSTATCQCMPVTCRQVNFSATEVTMCKDGWKVNFTNIHGQQKYSSRDIRIKLLLVQMLNCSFTILVSLVILFGTKNSW